MDSFDDPVTRNRSTHPRRTPDRRPLGDHLMPGLYAATGATLLVATAVLIVLLAT